MNKNASMLSPSEVGWFKHPLSIVCAIVIELVNRRNVLPHDQQRVHVFGKEADSRAFSPFIATIRTWFTNAAAIGRHLLGFRIAKRGGRLDCKLTNTHIQQRVPVRHMEVIYLHQYSIFPTRLHVY